MADKSEFSPLFTLPTLDQYQQAQKAQDTAHAGLMDRRMLNSTYDLARRAGYKSPEERRVIAANQIMSDAETAITEGDPMDRQIAVLSRAAISFNRLGMTDYVQQIAPEIARLRNQKLEQDKLMAQASNLAADTAGKKLDNSLKFFTFDSSVTKAEAEAKSAKLGYKLWFNQDTQRYAAVNEKDPDVSNAFVNRGFAPYEAGVGADKTELGKKGKDAMEADVIGSEQLLMQLRDNAAQFDPRYLTVGGKFDTIFANAKEIAGLKLSEEDRNFVAGMNSWRRGSYETMNNYIHKMTGAQMSVFETYRLVRAMPDPDRDGNTQYVAKLRDLVRATLQVRAYNMNRLSIGLQQDDGWKNPKALPHVSETEVDQFLGTNFGMSHSSVAGGKPETRTYKGKTYTLTPGTDRSDPMNWTVSP